MPPLDPDDRQWFEENLQPHEPMLRAWLRSRFSDLEGIDDVLQEAFLRVLQARSTAEIASPKAYLFAAARNLALGAARRKERRGEISLADLDEAGVLDDEADVSESVARAEELEMLTCGIQSLPTRCRQILTLRKIYGLSQKQVAEELGISVHTVETQGAIGLRKLSKYFRRFERR